MFGFSFEHLLVLLIILLIFGPKRLPELGNTFGKAIRNFKDSIAGVEEAKYRKMPDATSAETPAVAPKQDIAPELITNQPAVPSVDLSESTIAVPPKTVTENAKTTPSSFS